MKRSSFVLMLLAVLIFSAACGKSSPPAQSPAPTPVPAKDPVPAVEEAPAPTPPPEGAPDSQPQTAATPVKDSGETVVEGGTPKLVVPEPDFNFGERDNSESVSHDYILRNEGTGVLKIESVRASCGCTTTELPTNTLAPGEEVKLGAVLNLRGRQGPQIKTITLFSNDPDQPTLQLRMQGEAIASIAVDPMNVQFGRVEDDEPREASVTIKSTKPDVTFRIEGAEMQGMEFIDHEIITVEPEHHYELKVRTKGAVPPGHHNGRLIVRTDSRERQVIWIPISMQVIGALQIMPPIINIRYADEPDAVETQQLSISAGRVQEFAIEKAEAPLDSITVDLIPAGPNNYRLRLSNMPRSDALEGKAVVLHTNIPNQPTIEIPFNIFKPRRPEDAANLQITPPKLQQRPQVPPPGVEDVSNAPLKANTSN